MYPNFSICSGNSNTYKRTLYCKEVGNSAADQYGSGKVCFLMFFVSTGEILINMGVVYVYAIVGDCVSELDMSTELPFWKMPNFNDT